jgi:hypothetical protein
MHRSASRAGRARAGHLLSLGLVAAVFVTFGGALHYPFSQDDFWGLARALDIVPPMTTPWRFLSGQVYFDVMHAFAGLDPRPYHLASAFGHAACAVLLYAWIRRFCSRPASWLGALYFAVHPSAYTELYWISAVGEIYARLFALVALHLFFAPGARRNLAAPAFALSLLCKESTILFPLVPAGAPHVGGGPPRREPVARPALGAAGRAVRRRAAVRAAGARGQFVGRARHRRRAATRRTRSAAAGT